MPPRTDFFDLTIHSGYPFPHVHRTVHPKDGMYVDNPRHYLNVGRNAVDLIARHQPAAASILDIPCGFGRVTRTIKARFPDARLTVCDIDDQGVEFCAKTFNARGVQSHADFNKLELHEKYDVIWVGSLITHLDANAVFSFFKFILRHLNASGRAIISSHGAFVAGRLFQSKIEKRKNYGISSENVAAMVDAYFASGFGYAPYDSNQLGGTSYGISICNENWLRRKVQEAGAKVISFEEHAWDNHHDIIVVAAQ